MNNYTLVACDLDGTLMSSDLSLSDKNKQAIKAFREKGIPFVPCTGRTLSEMSDTVNNPDIRYYIYSNGAVIWDKETDDKIYMCLSKRSSNEVLDVLFGVDSYIIMHHGGETYTQRSAVERGRQDYNVSYNVDELIRDFSNIKEDLASFAYGLDNVESICVFFRNDEDTAKCYEKLLANDDLLIVKGWEYNFEIFSRAASKGTALGLLAEKLGISISDAIGIGDSGNDISMIETAGLGLATANACDELKNIADEVICSNDDSVADFVLRKYFNMR